MKTIFIVIALLVSLFQAVRAENYTWVIEKAKTGSGILYAPQNYIDGELNFDNLIVKAPKGTSVVAPVDGTITRVRACYYTDLSNTTGFGNQSGSIDDQLVKAQARLKPSMNPQFLCGVCDIRSDDGRVIHLSGLTGDLVLKTGQRIKKGERLGKVGYCYHKIAEPSIMISISKQSKADDPMSPFGLKSSFRYPSELKPIKSLTKEQAKEDVRVCIEALKEMCSGLTNIMTMDEVDRYAASLYRRIDAEKGDLVFSYFAAILSEITAKIHDSHIYTIEPEWFSEQRIYENRPSILMGWYENKLICYNASNEYWQLIGKEIRSVNSIDADSLKRKLTEKSICYDAQATKGIELSLALYGFMNLFIDDLNNTVNYDMLLEMSDGEKVTVKGLPLTDGQYLYWLPYFFQMINQDHDGYKLRILNENTAYIGISTFSLNQLQVENIKKFIASISGNKDNLIIDVRNNGGGLEDVVDEIYSFIAGEPFTINSFKKVNKRGNFKYFDYTNNYCGLNGEPLFGDEYVAEEGRDGFYNRSTEGKVIKPDSLTNYKGRVYVLANERSLSAGAIFPAMLVRGRRGVVVGRETSTAYHFMNALKFAKLRLPHSSIVVNIPLVGCYFDTVVNDRVPYGRGVLPDYNVPLTLDEIKSTHGDTILNYTLKLIEEGKYLSEENPFDVEADE